MEDLYPVLDFWLEISPLGVKTRVDRLFACFVAGAQ